jgi:hypothetical protein
VLLRHPGLPQIVKSKEQNLQIPDHGEGPTFRGDKKVECFLDFCLNVDRALDVLSVQCALHLGVGGVVAQALHQLLEHDEIQLLNLLA